MKCLTRSRASAEKAEAETSAELKGLKKSAPSSSSSSCVSSSISHHLDSDPKGPDNKENCKEKPCSVDVLSEAEGLLSSSSLAEDSGYLSLHNSHIEPNHDGDTHCAETLERRTEEPGCRLSPVRSDSSSGCLPVLKFQEEVCKQLAKGYRKSQSYDWTVVDKLAGHYGLHRVIGAKMGLEYVDVLCGLLKKDMKHILTRILGLLGDCDLINCKKVSRTWRKIIQQDDRAVQRCRKAEQMVPGKLKGSLSRDLGLSRVVFSCLQSVASSTPGHKPVKKTLRQTDGTENAAKPSRFAEFHEAAKSLKGHEALRSCRLCDSPARFDSAMKRAVCMRTSCAFVFCSLCQSAYHGSSPCQRGIIKASPHCQTVPLAGSARSKRSIRRL